MIRRVRRTHRNLTGAARVAAVGLCVCVAPTPMAQAEPALPPGSTQLLPPQDGAELRLIESTERDLDPLGLDGDTGADLEAAARALKNPAVPDPVARFGDVLTAVDGVFESAHRVRIRLDAGLAFIEETVELRNRTPRPAEVAYRLRVPADSVPWAFSVCVEASCRDAVRATPQQLAHEAARPATAASIPATEAPTGRLSVVRWGADRALAMLVRPVRTRPVTLRVSYVSAAPMHAGRVRWRLPARGVDPRLANARVEVQSGALSEIAPGAVLDQDPALPLALSATWTSTRRVVHERARSTCGGRPCFRTWRAAAPGPVARRTTWILIDSSPSMEGVARSRVPAVLAALLSRLPDDTKVRAFAFAAESAELGTWTAGEAPLSLLGDAALGEHGAATLVSRVLEPFHNLLGRERPRVIVLSDASLDPSAPEARALERARRAGADLTLVALADEVPNTPIADALRQKGELLHVTDLADRALLRDELEALGERLSAALTPRVSAGPRAGEAETTEHRSGTAWTSRTGSDWLPVWLSRHESQPSWLAAAQAREPALSAPPFVDVPPPAPPKLTALPKESVLDLLRTQLVPKARACLRTDRKGRADYATGLTFHFLIARREVLDARIEDSAAGALAGALRQCLLEVLPRLRLPWFTGTLRVRYPVHTEREGLPPQIALEPETAREVDRALAAPVRRQAP